jgi:hypothetical protein
VEEKCFLQEEEKAENGSPFQDKAKVLFGKKILGKKEPK